MKSSFKPQQIKSDIEGPEQRSGSNGMKMRECVWFSLGFVIMMGVMVYSTPCSDHVVPRHQS